jgi:TetR/AcrR family transcriptional repressor of bet genes
MPKVGMAPIRRRQVIEAVLEILEAEGWNGLTTKRVSERAGVSTGILAHYFGNKDSMVADAIRDAYRRFTDDVLETVALCHGAVEKLVALIDRLTPPSPAQVPEWTFWFAVWGRMPFDSEIRQELATVYLEYSLLVANILRDGMEEGSVPRSIDPELASDQFVALADGLGLRCHMDPEGFPASRLRDSLLRFWSERIGSPIAAR